MGQYHKIKCPTCGTAIEVDHIIDSCPACKAYIKDKFWQAGEGTGINTARVTGPGLRPLTNVDQDVY